MKVNYELSRKVALHQAFAGSLDNCKEIFEDLSDMQAYRKLKDDIDEFIELKSKQGAIQSNPLKFYLEEIAGTETLLLKIAGKITHLNSIGESLIKQVNSMGPRGAKSKSDRIALSSIEKVRAEIGAEIDGVGQVQNNFRNLLSESVWESVGQDFRLHDEVKVLCKINEKLIYNTVSGQIQENSETVGEVQVDEYLDEERLWITNLNENIYYLEFVFGRGRAHEQVVKQLGEKLKFLDDLAALYKEQAQVISDTRVELEKKNHSKAAGLLEKSARRIFSELDYEVLEHGIRKVNEEINTIGAKFKTYQTELNSIEKRSNNNPEQALRDRSKCIHINNWWESWLKDNYIDIFSDHPGSEARQEAHRNLEKFQKQFKECFDRVVPNVDVRGLMGEQDSLKTSLQDLLAAKMNWPGQVKLIKLKLDDIFEKWQGIKDNIKLSFANHNQSHSSEAAQETLAKVIADCDSQIDEARSVLNDKLVHSRAKLWGWVVCLLALMCVSVFLGHKHLRSLNVLDVKIISMSGKDVLDAEIKVNGVSYSSGSVLPTGSLNISVNANGYEQQEFKKNLDIGKPLLLGTIQLARSTGQIRISSTHNINWTASYVGNGEVNAEKISGTLGQGFQEISQFETGLWDISASLTNSTTKKIWSKNLSVKVAGNSIAEASMGFNGGSFELSSDAEGVEIYLDDVLVGTNRVSAEDIQPGEYTLDFRVDDLLTGKRKEKRIKLKVSAGEKTVVNESFEVASAMITSSPSGAYVIYNDKKLGETPLMLTTFLGGEYDLQLDYPDNFQQAIGNLDARLIRSKKVELKVGESSDYNFDLGLQSLTIESTPPGGRVKLYDQKERSFILLKNRTPLTLKNIKLGEYKVITETQDVIGSLSGLEKKWLSMTNSVSLIAGKDEVLKSNFGLSDLKLESTPSGAKIRLVSFDNSAPVKLGLDTPQVLTNLKPGPYRIVMEVDDLLGNLGNKEKLVWSITNQVNLVSGADLEINSDFTGGSVKIESNPAGAEILIGNRVIGKTPFAKSGLMPADVNLTLRIKDDFALKTKSGEWYSKTNLLKVVANKATGLEEQFKFGSIAFESEPKGAEVFFKGVSLGASPAIARIRPGEYKFDFRYPLMPPQDDYLISKTCHIKPSENQREKIEFKFASVNILTKPSDLVIDWNGEKSKSPFKFNKMKPGKHDFVIKSGISSTNLTMILEAGDNNINEVVFDSGVKFVTDPVGASISFKKEKLGLSPKEILNLLPGEYEFSVSKEGFMDINLKLRALPSKNNKFDFPLVPNIANPFRDNELRTVYKDYLKMPARSESDIADTLAWIVSKRNKRGYWNIKSGLFRDPRDTLATSLSLMGFLNEGHQYEGATPNDVIVTKGVNHILDNAQRSGCLDPDKSMLGHSIATILISNINKNPKNDKMLGVLKNAINYTLSQQKKDGLWGDSAKSQYETLFALYSFIVAEGAGLDSELFEVSRGRVEKAMNGDSLSESKELMHLLIHFSKDGVVGSKDKQINSLINSTLKSVPEFGKSGMLAECFLLSQIAQSLKQDHKLEILNNIIRRFTGKKKETESLEDYGPWGVAGEFCLNSKEHVYYNNLVPLIILQSFYQGRDILRPIELSIGYNLD